MKTSTKTVFVCTNCGAEYSRWVGRCTNCGEWNSVEEKSVVQREIKATRSLIIGENNVEKLGDVDDTNEKRVSTTFSEVDLILNGGIVENQVILISGEPGIGKSTLLLQILVELTKQGLNCLYASGEESLGQVTNRAARIYPQKDYQNVQFVLTSSLGPLLNQINQVNPDIVVVDSIQTMFDETVTGLPGSLSQVKAATSALVSSAKAQGFRLIIVGHINKEGEIAGPKVLEHLVDTVIRFEGEREGGYRLVRVLKNRFGTTGEVGILEMSGAGLKDADLEKGIFSGDGEGAVGAVKTLVMEGNRPIVVQVQALTNRTVFPYPKRVAEGVSISRLQLICAILDRFAGTKLGDQDVYVRTAGGYDLDATTSDLAIAAAILSSIKQVDIAPGDLFVGELSLGGKVTLPSMVASRLKNLEKYGVKRLFTNASLDSKKVSLETVRSLKELGVVVK